MEENIIKLLQILFCIIEQLLSCITDFILKRITFIIQKHNVK